MGFFNWNKKETQETEEAKETKEEKSEFESEFDKKYKIDNSDNHIEKQAMENQEKNKDIGKNTDTSEEDDEKDSAPERNASKKIDDDELEH